MKQRSIFIGLFLLTACQQASAQDSRAIFSAGRFRLYADSVTQYPFAGVAVSDSELRSDYRSPGNPYRSSRIAFKFSINGRDNEMKSGNDDHFNCTGLTNETPVIRFGESFQDTTTVYPPYLQPGATLKVRLDMRKVLTGFDSGGYYTLFNGQRLYKKDFKGVYIAGDAPPLTWDFDHLADHPDLRLQDVDGDGIFETTLALNKANDSGRKVSTWKLNKDISAFPQYHSGYPISDAVYNLALEEMIKAVESDSTFRTGKLWSGVWTRDISYSIILSMAYLQPRVAMNSLMRKVNAHKKIIQDTGTGGAYPVSSDRMIWAVAAWEVYETTGDEEWLQQAYRIIRNSVEDDLLNSYDRATGLVRGESSFLDWREQTYPAWMQPADIYASECLGTNAVHYQANIVLARMALLLHHPEAAQKYRSIAMRIKAGINRYLWQEDKGFYAQYRYGRDYKIVSGRAEGLGEALCILFDIADRKKRQRIVSRMPVTDFGIPCIYPQIPGIPPYHNNAVWPFVESFWAQASARADNEQSVMEAIAMVYRPAALFLTNKENFTAENGDYASTQINSDNMLWSLSGNISLVHKILFGIRFQPDSLLFRPFVPRELRGRRSLTNFTYRGAVLDITEEGYGDKVDAFYLDGRKLLSAAIPARLTGHHTVRIVIAGHRFPALGVRRVRNYTSPATPAVIYRAGYLRWDPVAGAVGYRVLRNGMIFSELPETRLAISDSVYVEWQVVAVDPAGVASFASEPVTTGGCVRRYEIEDFASPSALPYKGFSGKGFVETGRTINQQLTMAVEITEPGVYALDFRYANGNGPINTSNKCAIRTLREKGSFLGTIVLPQRGEDWNKWGFSNAVRVYLSKGTHYLRLAYEPQDQNMNGDINGAMLDYLRVVRLSGPCLR
ncbi:MAG TPA: trehalase family glycosidase [Puia sp.]|jgi:hypothetical protein|nr:trehalase family glycosidase [Puia sp.]